MITIRHTNYTFEASSINVTEQDGVWSLWAKVAGGNSRKLLEGSEAEVKEYRDAIEYAIENGRKIFKFEGGEK